MENNNNNQNQTEPSELEIVQKQAEEYLNNWKRERADFINYKKDESRRIEEIVKFANESVIMELIEAIDELEIVRRNFPEEAKDKVSDWLTELDKSTRKFQEFLNRYGVERIGVDGQFDPTLHEGVKVEEGGHKLQEVRAGYKMHDKVIRPARVKIIK